MSEFEAELRDKIIERLNLVDVTSDEIQADTVLFDGGLGLDSVDALEIAILIEEDYGIVIKVSERNETTFGTFGGLCRFVQDNRDRDRSA